MTKYAVIIPARNEETEIAKLLESLAKQGLLPEKVKANISI
jgi:glycosyltransferase involved in cell wall biosynthesis